MKTCQPKFTMCSIKTLQPSFYSEKLYQLHTCRGLRLQTQGKYHPEFSAFSVLTVFCLKSVCEGMDVLTQDCLGLVKLEIFYSMSETLHAIIHNFKVCFLTHNK